MGVFYETIPDNLKSWILQQHVFYVATSPLSSSGHINVSPKGGPYFGITSPSQFYYLDLSGSGIETIAHLHEPGNGRIVIMFNAFEGSPRIVRLWGRGKVLEYGTEEYEAFVKKRKEEEGEGKGGGGGWKIEDGTRAVVVVDVEQVGSSCGFSMPKYDFKEYRTALNEIFEKRMRNEEKGDWDNGIEKYWAWKNSYSVDGMPGLQRGVKTQQIEDVTPLKKMVGKHGELAVKPRSVTGRTVELPVWAISASVIAAFLMGFLTTIVFQDVLMLRGF